MRARATGKGVLTSPFKLLKSNHLGVVLTFAVYNTDLPPDATPEQRIEATVGYCLSSECSLFPRHGPGCAPDTGGLGLFSFCQKESMPSTVTVTSLGLRQN